MPSLIRYRCFVYMRMCRRRLCKGRRIVRDYVAHKLILRFTSCKAWNIILLSTIIGIVLARENFGREFTRRRYTSYKANVSFTLMCRRQYRERPGASSVLCCTNPAAVLSREQRRVVSSTSSSKVRIGMPEERMTRQRPCQGGIDGRAPAGAKYRLYTVRPLPVEAIICPGAGV